MYEPLFSGPLGDWLAGIGIVSCLYWAFRLLAALIRYAQAGAATPAAAPPELAEDLPVIAAAVAAMLDSHRIVHIAALPHGQVWSTQGRWLHQTSHRLQ
jgi:hypothetical protein